MALPKDSEPSGQVLSFAAAREPVPEVNHRAAFDRLNAQADASRRFIAALETLSEYRLHPRGEAEVMDALDQALACVIEATWANDGALLIRDEPSGDLIFALVHGDTPKKNLLWRRVPAGRGIAHWAASQRRATIVNNASNDGRFYSGIDAANGFRTRTVLAAPIIVADEVIGVFEVLNKNNGDFFSVSDQNHLTVLARLASVLLVQLRQNQTG